MRTMAPIRKPFLVVLSLSLIGVGGWYGRVVPFSEQWPMYEALRTTASIIFAVIGAWLAIIYPERLKLTYRPPSTQASVPGGSAWTQLLTPVFNSTAILAVILLLGAFAPILKHHPLPVDISVMRGLSYGLLVSLTIWQLWTVVLTLVPADILRTNQERANQSAVIAQSFGTAGQAAPHPPP